MNSGINYNIDGAERVTENIAEQVKNVGVGLKNEFETFKNSFRREWVGGDEYAFENVFLAQLHDIFRCCIEIGSGTSDFVIEVATSFRDMQNKQAAGILEDASGLMSANSETFSFNNDVQMTQDIASKYHVDTNDTIFSVQATEAPTFDKSVQLGLQNSSSADILVGIIETFATDVNNIIKGLTSNVDIGNAFVADSGDGTMGIKTLVEKVIEGMAEIDKQVVVFKETVVPNLIQSFNSQKEAAETAASGSAEGTAN
jgi:hypothetical protein